MVEAIIVVEELVIAHAARRQVAVTVYAFDERSQFFLVLPVQPDAPHPIRFQKRRY
jgi:hypothetical protein